MGYSKGISRNNRALLAKEAFLNIGNRVNELPLLLGCIYDLGKWSNQEYTNWTTIKFISYYEDNTKYVGVSEGYSYNTKYVGTSEGCSHYRISTVLLLETLIPRIQNLQILYSTCFVHVMNGMTFKQGMQNAENFPYMKLLLLYDQDMLHILETWGYVQDSTITHQDLRSKTFNLESVKLLCLYLGLEIQDIYSIQRDKVKEVLRGFGGAYLMEELYNSAISETSLTVEGVPLRQFVDISSKIASRMIRGLREEEVSESLLKLLGVPVPAGETL